MKKIIKEDLSAVAFSGDELGYPNQSRVVDYPHDNEVLAEIAGIVLNKRLKYKEIKNIYYLSTDIIVQLCSYNPHQTSLYQMFNVSDLELAQVKYAHKLKESVLEKAVESLLDKAMDSVDKIHNLENSFWKRLKYLFNSMKK